MAAAKKALFVWNDSQSPYCNSIILQDCTYKGTCKTVEKFSLLHNDGEVRLSDRPHSVVSGEVWEATDAKLAAMDKMERVASPDTAKDEEEEENAFEVIRKTVKVLLTNEETGEETEIEAATYVTSHTTDLDDWELVSSGQVQAVLSPDKDDAVEEDDEESSENDFKDTPANQTSAPITGVAEFLTMMRGSEASRDEQQSKKKRTK